LVKVSELLRIVVILLQLSQKVQPFPTRAKTDPVKRERERERSWKPSAKSTQQCTRESLRDEGRIEAQSRRRTNLGNL
jgi:hypothetical protein